MNEPSGDGAGQGTGAESSASRTTREAFYATQAEREALNERELRGSLNVDVEEAHFKIVGCMPKLLTLRPQVIQLAFFDMRHFDMLETYALALVYAHAKYLTALLPPSATPIAERLGSIRERLRSDADGLDKRGRLAGQLKRLNGGPAYAQVADDVRMLCGVLRRSWPNIESRTVLTLDELDEAERLAEDLLRRLGTKNDKSPAQQAAAAVRLRAFTLFIRAYEQVGRVVAYLRFDEKDADAYLPVIRGRPRSRQKKRRSQKE